MVPSPPPALDGEGHPPVRHVAATAQERPCPFPRVAACRRHTPYSPLLQQSKEPPPPGEHSTTHMLCAVHSTMHMLRAAVNHISMRLPSHAQSKEESPSEHNTIVLKLKVECRRLPNGSMENECVYSRDLQVWEVGAGAATHVGVHGRTAADRVAQRSGRRGCARVSGGQLMASMSTQRSGAVE